MTDSPAKSSHLRGSSLLVLGRIISLLLNFTVQVLIVRTLTKSDFGAFAFALSVVAILTNLNLLGLSKAVARSLALHHDRHQAEHLAGVLISSFGVIVSFGAVIVLGVLLSRGVLQGSVATDPRSIEVLVWMILLVPIQAIDNVLQNTSTVFVGARAIFFRRYILGPSLKLVSVLIVLLFDAGLQLLTVLYLLASLFGVLLYVSMLRSAFHDSGIVSAVKARRFKWPGMSLVLLAGPLLATDLVVALESNLAILLLENSRGAESVASLRAIVPLVGLVFVVSEGFKFLYLPLATRLFARGDSAGVSQNYWQSFRWITLLSFPVALVLMVFSERIVDVLFGTRYQESALLLTTMVPMQVLAAMMALNHFTLTALNRGRFMMVSNTVSLVVTLLLALVLTPLWGALGAAFTISASILFHYTLQGVGLRGSGIGLPGRTEWLMVAQAILTILVMLLLKYWLGLGEPALLLGVLLAFGLLFLLFGRSLNIANVFPELAKLPLLGWWVR